MVNKRQFELDLLRALGLEGRLIAELTITVRARELPTVTITEYPSAVAGKEAPAVLGRYTLVPKDEPPRAANDVSSQVFDGLSFTRQFAAGGLSSF
jgi:hypothetical protein